MNKNLLFLALILAVTTTALFPTEREANVVDIEQTVCHICLDPNLRRLLTTQEAQAIFIYSHHYFHRHRLQQLLDPNYICPICRAPDGHPQPQASIDLIQAAKQGDIESVRALLADGTLVNTTNVGNKTALHFAAEYGHTAIVQALIDAGANVNAQTLLSRSTALHFAAENDHEATVAILLAGHANPTIRNHWGKTAFDIAANAEIYQLLLAAQRQ